MAAAFVTVAMMMMMMMMMMMVPGPPNNCLLGWHYGFRVFITCFEGSGSGVDVFSVAVDSEEEEGDWCYSIYLEPSPLYYTRNTHD